MTSKTGSIKDLFGIVKYDGPPITIEQMDEEMGEYLGQDDESIKREYREYLESEKSS